MQPDQPIEPARLNAAGRSVAGALGLSVLGGAVWGVLSAWVWMAHEGIALWLHPEPPGDEVRFGFDAFLLYAICGGLMGVVCGLFVSPLIVAALWRRDPLLAGRRIVLPVSGVVVLLTIADLIRGGGAPVSNLVPAGPVAFFVLYTFWVGRRLPPMQPEGCCMQCGYDVRASLEFGRCPECGTPI